MKLKKRYKLGVQKMVHITCKYNSVVFLKDCSKTYALKNYISNNAFLHAKQEQTASNKTQNTSLDEKYHATKQSSMFPF